ncbi:hypothetical protein NKH77_18995 [Streptomyces sp. M19]
MRRLGRLPGRPRPRRGGRRHRCTRGGAHHRTLAAALFEQLGFGALSAVPEPGLPAHDDTKDFPVSHTWAHVPVHLTGWNVLLDVRTPHAAPQAPQSMVQEYLNRSGDKALWVSCPTAASCGCCASPRR